MNDQRFIEMLNLYIDRELVGEQIREIEEAIATSPERQRIYAQYCQIERATQMLLTETDVPQPSISNLVAADQSGAASVVDFEPAAEARPIWKTWGGAMAGLAAACFAFVAYFGTPSSVNDDSIARVISESAPTVAIAQSEESDYQTVFVLNPENTNDLLPGMRAVDDSFAWMTQLQFAPIERTEIDGWEMQPAAPIEVRSLNARWISPEEPQAMTALQFQR